MDTRKIVCAAVKTTCGKTIYGPRHSDCFHAFKHMPNLNPAKSADSQGFSDQNGNFLTRKQAYPIAKRRGQILEDSGNTSDILFSEDLY